MSGARVVVIVDAWREIALGDEGDDLAREADLRVLAEDILWAVRAAIQAAPGSARHRHDVGSIPGGIRVTVQRPSGSSSSPAIALAHEDVRFSGGAYDGHPDVARCPACAAMLAKGPRLGEDRLAWSQRVSCDHADAIRAPRG